MRIKDVIYKRDVLAYCIDWLHLMTVRHFLHWSRMRHIAQGRDWRFYEAQSIKEIITMKLDGTEEQKLEMWSRGQCHRTIQQKP